MLACTPPPRYDRHWHAVTCAAGGDTLRASVQGKPYYAYYALSCLGMLLVPARQPHRDLHVWSVWWSIVLALERYYLHVI